MRLPGIRWILVAVVMSACSGPEGPDDHARPMALHACHLDRLAEDVLCGAHEVFEDRDARGGRKLSIHVAVMPALRRTAASDPLFILAGGPGQGARGFSPAAARYFKKVRRTRAIVLVDLRGTGASGALTCPREGDDRSPIDEIFLGPADVARCRESLDADPRRYTHADALADLDEIRQRLGYARINMWGGSWGTRAALLYAMTYPHAVRTVVLDGAVSMAMEFPRTVASNAERAFERLLAACAAEPACAATHANARTEFAALLARLETRQPASKVKHPRTGERVALTLSRDAVAEIVRVALYTPGDAVRVLQIIRHAFEGDFGPLLAQAMRSASFSIEDMALGQTLSVLCSEDLPLVAGADFARDAASTFLRASYADGWRRRCQEWPLGRGIGIDRAATSSVPALILSGEHDPVTPPATGDAMTRHFPNHQHLVVPGAAHNVSFSGCVPDLIASFIERGSADGIDASCVSEVGWPPAVVSDAGTTP